MLNRQPPDQDSSASNRDKRARIQARLHTMHAHQADDDTRKIGPPPVGQGASYDGSLAQPAQDRSINVSEIEARAYFLTAEGGVLAEVPCREDAGVLTIGRGQAADIRVDDPYVHRRQAEIHWDVTAQAHVISHGGGENSTFVNRHRIVRPFRLTGGETLRFGKTRLIYRIRR